MVLPPPVPEMDLSVAGEADSINALCSQINSSFTKPSEDLCAKATSNGLPACTVPPAIPPPPAPLQGEAGDTHTVKLYVMMSYVIPHILLALHQSISDVP